ncbi:MAG: glycoside hydrolase [Chitinophagaceae bacterium]
MKKISLAIVCVILTCVYVTAQPVVFTLHTDKAIQTIDNIGASGAWFSEGIGKYWPAEKKQRMAELLFSKAFDKNGNPLGIGLSAWRFNIGGGTTEQGDSSGISSPVKRVECFLSPDGKYDWNKQAGYMWFVKQAAAYGVENLIAFSNTPPVQFTKNGLGFKTEKNYEANLRADKYAAYAGFLADVIAHFNKEGLHFNYISPVNEPQWDWSAAFGKMNQEGSPWHNEDIYKITVSLDSALSAQKLSSKILVAEAGILSALYNGGGRATSQIQSFYNPASPLYIGKLKNLLPVIEGHSYFTDNGDSNIIKVRSRVRDTAAQYKTPFWQSEYCLLGDGYKEGVKGKTSAMDCALFLSKIIYHDLAIADAAAWHLWNSWEPGDADYDTRYYMLALKNNEANTTGDFTITKNLWALGHYSRFVRPGMKRIVTDRSDKLNDVQAAQDIMLSAYTDNKKIVVVCINYAKTSKQISLDFPGFKKPQKVQQYLTTAAAEDNMKYSLLKNANNIALPARSISTFVLE